MPTRKITRVARRAGAAGAAGSARSLVSPKEFESASLTDFLCTLQHGNVALLPVSPHKALGILGRGLSGLIQQSIADLSTSLTFKEGVPSRNIHDTEQDQDWYSLITETTILEHGPVKANPHFVDLLGVSFSVPPAQASAPRAWPLLITSKVNRGDLSTILRDEASHHLSSDMRMMLFAELSEAVFVLHACGATHGDLKSDNILIQISETNELNLLLIDFGSSAIFGQTRVPTRSEPWNAPEVDITGRSLTHDELVQIDLYSFGLVCLHLLLPLTTLVEANLCLIQPPWQTEDEWTKFLRNVTHSKVFQSGQGFVARIHDAIASADAPSEQKSVLKIIVSSTLQPTSGKRSMPWDEILPHIEHYLSNSYHKDARSKIHAPPLASSSVETGHSMHRMLDLGKAIGDLDDMDYVLPMNILQDLEYKADHSPCSICRQEYAFLACICHAIGFGARRNTLHYEAWLTKSGKNQDDLERSIEDIAKRYRLPGRVSEEVLNALGIGVIVSAERAEEYRMSRRLVEAEQSLKDQFEARATAFGESHIALAKPASELTQVLQTRFQLAEAKNWQHLATKILKDRLDDRHPALLMANINLASITARQGLLQEAETLAADTLHVIIEVLGPEHPECITAVQINATIQFELGKHEEAEDLMRRAVELRTNALTKTHPLTLRAALSLASLLRARGRLTESGKLMDKIENDFAGILPGDNLLKAQIYMVQAMHFKTIGSLNQALEKIAAALAAMDALRLPENDTLRLDGLEILSTIHGAAMERDKQEAILRQILEQKGSESEKDHETCTTKCLLAGNLLAQFKLDEADTVADEVLLAIDRSLTEDPEHYLTATDILASTLAYRGKIEEAEKMRRDVLGQCVKTLGETNQFTLIATYRLGLFFADRGEHQEAQRLYEQTLLHLGDNPLPSVDAIKVKRWLTWTLVQQGLFDRAKTECQQGIAWAITAVGEQHVETLALYNSLGKIYILTRQLAEADELFRTKLETQCTGTEVEEYVLEHISVLRRLQYRIPEAMRLKQKSEALMTARLGQLHPEVIRMRSNVLRDYMNDAELFTTDVENEVLDNIERKKTILGKRHPSTIMSIADLAYAYATQKRLPEAEELYEQIWEVDMLSRLKSPDEYAKVLGKRAEVLFGLQRLGEAEALEREALGIRLSIFDRSHSAVLTNMGNLASTLNAQGKSEEAEGYLREVVTLKGEGLENDVQSMFSFLKSRMALGAVLYSLGRLVESADLYTTSIEIANAMELPNSIIEVWKEDLREVMAKSMGED